MAPRATKQGLKNTAGRREEREGTSTGSENPQEAKSRLPGAPGRAEEAGVREGRGRREDV